MWSDETRKGLVVNLKFTDDKLQNEEKIPIYIKEFAQQTGVLRYILGEFAIRSNPDEVYAYLYDGPNGNLLATSDNSVLDNDATEFSSVFGTWSFASSNFELQQGLTYYVEFLSLNNNGLFFNSNFNQYSGGEHYRGPHGDVQGTEYDLSIMVYYGGLIPDSATVSKVLEDSDGYKWVNLTSDLSAYNILYNNSFTTNSDYPAAELFELYRVNENGFTNIGRYPSSRFTLDDGVIFSVGSDSGHQSGVWTYSIVYEYGKILDVVDSIENNSIFSVNSDRSIDINQVKYNFPSQISATYSRLVANLDGELTWIGNYVELTANDALSLVTNSELEIGSLYMITGTNPDLYSGTTVFLNAVSKNDFNRVGVGKFYNPKYDLFPLYSGNSIYILDDTVVYGGKVWYNTGGSNDTPVSNFELGGNWTPYEYDTEHYNIVYDIIEYDLYSDTIIYRKDELNNSVSCGKRIDGRETWEAIKCFKWGDSSTTKICNNYIFNSIVNILNLSINSFYGNSFVTSIFDQNVAENLTFIDNVVNQTSISSNSFLISNISNNLFNASSISNTTTYSSNLTYNNIHTSSLSGNNIQECIFSYNTISSNSSMTNCVFSASTLITYNQITNSTIYDSNMENSFISNNLISSTIRLLLPPTSIERNTFVNKVIDIEISLLDKTILSSPVIPYRAISNVNDDGYKGEICFDNSNLYICIDNNVWTNVKLSSI
jgi:hypothetical protein